jgi:tight adherence protein B
MRASALVLGLLPLVVGVILFFINRDLMSVLLTDPRGRFMMGIALVSLMIGIAVMTIMIKKSLR